MKDGVTLNKAKLVFVAFTGKEMALYRGQDNLQQGNTCIGCSDP